jgi:hypothetical protein
VVTPELPASATVPADVPAAVPTPLPSVPPAPIAVPTEPAQ